jgi:hypothetical protein
MKSLKTRLMVAAAALAVVAGSAAAQSYKAEIPVTFRAGEKLMLPGSYELRVDRSAGGIPQVFVRNLDRNTAIALIPRPGADAPKAWRDAGNPMLAFECAEGRCVMRSLWTGSDDATYAFPGSITPGGDSKAAFMLVTMTHVK